MWKTVKLGDICKIFNGGTPKSNVKGYWEGDVQWLTPKDMGKLISRYVANTERKITVDGLNNSSAKLVPSQSVILSCRAPIGHVFINEVEMSFNQGCKGLVPTDEITVEYLYYFLFSSKQLLNDLGTGTTFKEISGKTLSNVEIPLPPLAEQQRIVAKLDAAFSEIDGAIELEQIKSNECNRLDDALRESIQRKFSHLSQAVKLSDLIAVRSGDFLPKKKMNLKGCFNVYGGNGHSGLHDEYNLSGQKVVIGRVGQKCGNVRMLNEDFWLTDNAFYVSEMHRQIDAEYLASLLASCNLRQYARNGDLPVLSFKGLKDVEVPFVESTDAQKEIVQQLKLAEETLASLNTMNIEKIRLYAEMKASVLRSFLSSEAA